MKNLSKEIENAVATLNNLKFNADGTEKVRPNAKTKRQIALVEKKIISMQAELDSAPKMLEAPKEENSSATDVNLELLAKLSAINITDKIKTATDKRSIFKKEFNDKSSRTKCRTKFLNAIQIFLLQSAHNKKESALEALNLAKSLAKHYYSAEDSFKKYSDYCTENMEADKKNAIKLFIEVVNV